MNSESKINRPKKYKNITLFQRLELLNLVLIGGLSIRQACILAKINYHSAKSILKVFNETGRTEKKKTRKKPMRQKAIAKKEINLKQKIIQTHVSQSFFKLQPIQPIIANFLEQDSEEFLDFLDHEFHIKI